MPRRDGTGPLGQGLVAGRRRVPLGRGQRPIRRSVNQLKECICPDCGYKESNTRGVPCTERNCPKCGAVMRGVYCS